MNIIFYAPNYYPATRYGGPIRSSHGLASALVRAGHRVQVFTTDVDGPERLDVPLCAPTLLDGVEVRYFPLNTPKRIYHAPMMDAALATEIPKADVVHTNGMFLWPGPRAALHADRHSKTLVVSPRGMLVPEMIAGKSALMKHAWINLMERQGLKAASVIHLTSEEEANGVRALRLNLAPMGIVGNGVDTPAYPPRGEEVEALWGATPRGRRVAFLARLDWTKGADLAVEAAVAIPDVHLLLAGPDQLGLQAHLAANAAAAGAADRVRFVGQLNDARKWAFLAGADVLIAPSIKESFGLAVAEALAMGVPVITTPGVGANTIVRRIDSECVVARDGATLSHALAALLDAPQRRADFGANAKAIMQAEYSWDVIAAQMVRLYANEHHFCGCAAG